ncbi:MAG: ribosome maturation factor RimP [Chitinispirillaceae bacterium]|nr:ribosome maturation factor RimP [Chitinispirillaceae bacterium]
MIPEALRERVASSLDQLGFELFELQLVPAGRRAVLRVTIDSANGVTIGDCERVSDELSLLLDVEDFLSGNSYTLEVSSPGIDRKLKTERDFKRAVGRVVIMQMRPAFDGKKTLRMSITACDGEYLRGEIDGQTISLPLDMIASGKEELQFK